MVLSLQDSFSKSQQIRVVMLKQAVTELHPFDSSAFFTAKDHWMVLAD